jgi:hypothetical protein
MRNDEKAHSEEQVELSVVVPVYREEKAVPIFLGQVRPVLESITSRYEIVFCLDPSDDGTEQAICIEALRELGDPSI